MVAHASLREIVGANTLGTVAGSDLAPALSRTFTLALLPLEIVKSRAQDRQCLGTVDRQDT